MARCYFRWRNVLICLCTPCILVALLFAYLLVSMSVIMASHSDPVLSKDLFIAPGVYRNRGLAPHPKTFWKPLNSTTAVWNRLQLRVDRYYNPILNQNYAKRRSGVTFEAHMRARGSGNFESEVAEFSKLPQQMRDFISSMHQRRYPILIQPHMACGAGAKEENEPPLLLLAIKTTVMNFANRQAIRQTWGKEGWVSGGRTSKNGTTKQLPPHGGAYVRRVFLLGQASVKDSGMAWSELLELENRHYGDILQWDFKDSFFNLTLKDVLFWEWFSGACPRTRFVFKGDDDVFVNTPRMLDYLRDRLAKPGADKAMKTFMVGDVIGAAKPIRQNTSKYFVPASFYMGFYPAYAGGGGVVYSSRLVRRLNHISRRVHLFPIDDVYVGMCMSRLNAYPDHHPAFLTFDFPGKTKTEKCAYHTILLVHKRSPSEITTLWSELNSTQSQCWNVTMLHKAEKKADQKASLTKAKITEKKNYLPMLLLYFFIVLLVVSTLIVLLCCNLRY